MNSSKSDNIFSNNQSIKDYDSELWLSFQKEAERQEDHIELIESENYASKEFLKPKDLYLLTNMRKAILQKGIMEDVKMSILQKI